MNLYIIRLLKIYYYKLVSGLVAKDGNLAIIVQIIYTLPSAEPKMDSIIFLCNLCNHYQ